MATRSRSTTRSEEQSKRSGAPSGERGSKRSAPAGTTAPIFAVQPEPWKPHKGQLKAVKWLVEHACGALFLDPGVGKTSATLAAIAWLKKRGLVDKALVLAPLRVATSVWPQERERWEDFHGLRMVVLHGKDKDALLNGELPADVYVTNYDSLAWLLDVEVKETPTGKKRPQVDLRRWRSFGFDLLVLDELSKVKNTDSQRHRMLMQVAPTFGRRWGLTGSPAANGLIDLFGQCRALDEGRSLGKWVTHFRRTYFDPIGPPAVPGKPPPPAFGWTLKPGADAEIYKRIKPLALRMAAEEYVDMPQLVERVVRVQLPKEAKQLHDDMEEELIAGIGDRTVVAANAAAASSKCRQIANGAIYVDEADLGKSWRARAKGREFAPVHEAKLDALADLVDELQGSPLLVAYDFNHDLDRLLGALGKDTPHIGGGVTPKRALEVESAWNRGEVPVLLGHPQSLAHGLNLQRASCHVAFFALTWNFELYDQFVRRVFRQGNRHDKVFVHLFVAHDTVDDAVLGAIRSKAKGQRALFEALRSRAAARRGLA